MYPRMHTILHAHWRITRLPAGRNGEDVLPVVGGGSGRERETGRGEGGDLFLMQDVLCKRGGRESDDGDYDCSDSHPRLPCPLSLSLVSPPHYSPMLADRGHHSLPGRLQLVLTECLSVYPYICMYVYMPPGQSIDNAASGYKVALHSVLLVIPM